MCDCGIQADAVTCCSLINAMDRAGLWQVAELVLLALCASMPSFRDMRALPPLDLSAFLDASDQALVHTLCVRLSGGGGDGPREEGTPSDAPSLPLRGATPLDACVRCCGLSCMRGEAALAIWLFLYVQPLQHMWGTLLSGMWQGTWTCAGRQGRSSETALPQPSVRLNVAHCWHGNGQ